MRADEGIGPYGLSGKPLRGLMRADEGIGPYDSSIIIMPSSVGFS